MAKSNSAGSASVARKRSAKARALKSGPASKVRPKVDLTAGRERYVPHELRTGARGTPSSRRSRYDDSHYARNPRATTAGVYSGSTGKTYTDTDSGRLALTQARNKASYAEAMNRKTQGRERAVKSAYSGSGGAAIGGTYSRRTGTTYTAYDVGGSPKKALASARADQRRSEVEKLRRSPRNKVARRVKPTGIRGTRLTGNSMVSGGRKKK